jgi:hypothetical protein
MQFLFHFCKLLFQHVRQVLEYIVKSLLPIVLLVLERSEVFTKRIDLRIQVDDDLLHLGSYLCLFLLYDLEELVHGNSLMLEMDV